MQIARLPDHEPTQSISPLALSKILPEDFCRFAPGFERELLICLHHIDITVTFHGLDGERWQFVAGICVTEPPQGFAETPYGTQIRYPDNAYALAGDAISVWIGREYEWQGIYAHRLARFELARLANAHAFGNFTAPDLLPRILVTETGRAIAWQTQEITTMLTRSPWT